MSASSVDSSSVASAIPDEDWECPQISPPPPPPSPPPLPVCEQSPVEERVFKDNILARPPISYIDIEEEAELELGILEERARKRRFGALIAHLPYSKVDWAIPTQMLDAGGTCIIPGAGCKGVSMNTNPLFTRLRVHLKTAVHLKHEEKVANAVADATSPPREPKFVIFRTMNIEFLDPGSQEDLSTNIRQASSTYSEDQSTTSN